MNVSNYINKEILILIILYLYMSYLDERDTSRQSQVHRNLETLTEKSREALRTKTLTC